MKARFRSPTGTTLDAALVPARLAERYSTVLWRELAGGDLEVAMKAGGCVERLHVHHNGDTTPIGTTTYRARLFKISLFGAIAAGATAVLLTVDDNSKWFLTAFVSLFAVGIVNDLAGDLRPHLRRTLGQKHEWHEPTKLHGWTPKTTAQLAAVERCATDHGGTAFVSDVGAATIDVVVGLHRYVLDADGDVVLHEPNRFRTCGATTRSLGSKS